ncbi:MAG TPA: WD40 repeat domain-containing protein [Pirellulales bacterium]|jgi:WD40 repeat protein|nr:WD40 repeat domain-containing protein [Pirellulales bacterium]
MRAKLPLILVVSLIATSSSAMAAANNQATRATIGLDALDRGSIPAEIRKSLPSNVVAFINDDPRPVSALAFTPDGRTLVLAHEGGPRKGDSPGIIEVWDLSHSAPQRTAQLDGHRDWIASLAISPNGRILVWGGARFDQSVHFWDLSGRKPRPAAVLAPFSHWWHVALVFSPDGKWLVTASGSDQGPAQLWDVSAGPKDVKQGPVLPGPAWGISTMAYSHDGRFLAAALGSGHQHPNDGTLLVWKKGGTGYELVSKTEGKAHEISSLAFSPADDALVTGYAGGGLRMWDFADGAIKEKTSLRDEGNPLRVVAFLPSGGRLFSARNDGTVDEWDDKVGKDQQWKLGESLTSMATAPHQPYLAVGLSDGQTMILHMPSMAPDAVGAGDDHRASPCTLKDAGPTSTLKPDSR